LTGVGRWILYLWLLEGFGVETLAGEILWTFANP
jgi:hypothetical protein